jgi:hypothetical protein
VYEVGCLFRVHSDGERQLNSCVGWVTTLIVLTAICVLACAFYVYALSHWMPDTKDKRTTRPAAESQADEKQKPPLVMDSSRARGTDALFAARSQRPTINAGRSRGSRFGCPECERNAYEAIARSWSKNRKMTR